MKHGRWQAFGTRMIPPDLQRRLDEVLQHAGCRQYTARDALADAAECWREIQQDDVEHGESGHAPFWSYVANEGVGVITFYGQAVEFYVVRGSERDLRNRFDHLAMEDVEQARVALATGFQSQVPTLAFDLPQWRAWLASCSEGHVTDGEDTDEPHA